MIALWSAFCRRAVMPAVLVCAAFVQSPVAARADDAPVATGQQTNGKARAEILSLKRTEGDTLTLRFAIVNDNNNDFRVVLSNMRLVDVVNRREYSPGLSSPPGCAIPSGERRICWAIFAAPNASVHVLNVQFYEDFGLIPTPIGN